MLRLGPDSAPPVKSLASGWPNDNRSITGFHDVKRGEPGLTPLTGAAMVLGFATSRRARAYERTGPLGSASEYPA